MCVYVYVCVLVAQSCLTLWDPIDCSPPGSSVHGLLQARILEWVAIPFSRRSSQPRDWTQVSHIVDRFQMDKYTFVFIFFAIMGYHRILNIVPCAIQKDLVVYSLSTDTNSHLLIPNSHSYPLSPHFHDFCIHCNLFSTSIVEHSDCFKFFTHCTECYNKHGCTNTVFWSFYFIRVNFQKQNC